MKKAEKRKTWAEPAPNEDDDSATNRILENQRHNINYTIRHGLKINQRAKKKDIYKTAGRKHQTCNGMPKSRWGEEDESKYEVKAHIRDTDTLLQTSEWDTLVGTGITHLVVEDHDNVLAVIPTHVAEIQTLRSLTIMWSKVKVIPEHVLQMSLQELSLQKCPIKEIPGIRRMEKLVKLEISHACIKKIPIDIGAMVKLKYLDLNGNRLKVLPVSIGNLRNLEILKVCANRLKALPETLTDLSSLHTLDASQNQIKELPVDIGRLSNLVTLRMSHNQMDSLPESVHQLCCLRNLFISYNLFSEIPVVLCHMNELLTLNLVGNHIRGFSTPLPNLTTLLLDKNSVEVLQVPLFGCVNLETLSLQFNKITTVPPEIKRLTKLRVLYLGGNDIKSLPDQICELKDLRHLVMRETAIQELPKYFDTLRKLSVVDIDATKLSMQYMHALRKDGVEGLLRHVEDKRNSETLSSSEGGERDDEDEDEDDEGSRELESDESEPEAPPGGRTVTFRLPGKQDGSKTMPANTHVARKNIISLWPEDRDVPALLRDSMLSDDGSVRVNTKRRQIQTMMPDYNMEGVHLAEPIAHQSVVWSDETKRDSAHRGTEAIEMTNYSKKPSSDSEEELSEMSDDQTKSDRKETPALKPAIQFDNDPTTGIQKDNHNASFSSNGNDTESGSDFEEIPERTEKSPPKVLLESAGVTNILRHKEATKATESESSKRASVNKPPPAAKPDRLSGRQSANVTSQALSQPQNGHIPETNNNINPGKELSDKSSLIREKDDTGKVAYRQSAGEIAEKRASKPKPPVAEKPSRLSLRESQAQEDEFDDDDDDDPLANLKASLIGRDPSPTTNNKPQFHIPIIESNLHDIKE